MVFDGEESFDNYFLGFKAIVYRSYLGRMAEQSIGLREL